MSFFPRALRRAGDGTQMTVSIMESKDRFREEAEGVRRIQGLSKSE